MMRFTSSSRTTIKTIRTKSSTIFISLNRSQWSWTTSTSGTESCQIPKNWVRNHSRILLGQ
jgi:hypothetical protein